MRCRDVCHAVPFIRFMLSYAVMHCRDVSYFVPFRTMLGHAVMHCRDFCFKSNLIKLTLLYHET
jgi:hypothetical protein